MDVGSAVSGGAGIIGGIIQGDATSSAAQTQVDAANRAAENQMAMYQQNRADLAPWRKAGGAALDQLSYLMGLPGYNNVTTKPVASSSVFPNSTVNQNYGGGSTYDISRPYAQSAIFKISVPGSGSYTWDANSGKVWNDVRNSDGSSQIANDQITQAINSQLRPMMNTLVEAPVGSTRQINLSGVNLFPNAQVPAAAGSAYAGGTSGTSTNTPNVNTALGSYGSLAKPFSMADYQADPGYAFRLAEGQKAIQRSQAARGGLLSGAAVKAANNYAQDSASAEFQNAYNRFNQNQTNLFNRLSGISGTGQQTGSTLANLGQNAVSNANNYLTSGATAQSAAQMANGAAWQSGLTNIGNQVGSWLNGDNSLSNRATDYRK